MTQIICGGDVSARTLDTRIEPGGPARSFPNTPEGCAAMAAFCRENRVDLVALEATGGYEQQPFRLLWAAGVPCALLNPRQVRRFAEAMGILEKTDRIDAGVIARFAQVRRIKPRPPATPAQEQLSALVTRLRQLVEARIVQTNQGRLVTEPHVRASIAAMLELIACHIAELEQAITALLRADPLWQRFDAGFRTIKGVADRTVARLLAEMPEIGTLSGKAVAKLAGLAPIARDSGQSHGRRLVRGGRSGVRAILFVVVGCVRRFDPDFVAFDRRLREAGKPPKVIRIALAHKLLVRLNAKAREIRAETAAAA